MRGEGNHRRFGQVSDFTAPLPEARLIGEEAVPHLDVRGPGEESAEHRAERVFRIGQRPFPVRLDHDEPNLAGDRLDALASPGCPRAAPFRLPLALKALAIRRQFEPPLAHGTRLLVLEYQLFAIHFTRDCRFGSERVNAL